MTQAGGSAGAPFLVPYGQGAARGLGLAELGVHGVQMDRLVALGLPTVPGITLPVAAAESLTDPVVARHAVDLVEAMAGRKVGDSERPMLLRLVASTAVPASGLPPDFTTLGLTPKVSDELLAVMGRDGDLFVIWSAMLRQIAEDGLGLSGDDLDDLLFDTKDPRAQVKAMLELCATKGTRAFPEDPAEQVALAARTMLTRWAAPRAQRARKTQGLDPELGISLHLQALRIGPWEQSGFGVATSRDPATGLAAAQGSFFRGIRRSAVATAVGEPLSSMPGSTELLQQALTTLEHYFRVVAEVSFELRDGELALLSAGEAPRPGPLASVRLAVELAEVGTISTDEAVRSVRPQTVQELLHPQLALAGGEPLFVTGLGASPGAASGRIVLSSTRALELSAEGVAVVLVASETSPADVPALLSAQAVLTTNGGLASHAAVVARGAGRPAICGAADMHIDLAAGTVTSGDLVMHEGDIVSLDGSTGRVYLGGVSVRPVDPPPELDKILGWADQARRMQVRTNADTGVEAATAVRLGAQGIGLCRTEHQFLGDRLPLIRRLILAEDPAQERNALVALGQAQREDFRALLLAMGGRPVTVRLLDAPLHEFIAHDGEYETELQAQKALSLREANSMLGLRGVRLAILHEGLYPAQVEALVRAWDDVRTSGVTPPALEIMVPLVSLPEELALVIDQIHAGIATISAELGITVPYTVGSMVETPRAALLADKLAEISDFLSFGTNDLTQLTYGFSRDDVEKHVLGAYIERGLLSASPFAELDPDGVGALVATAVRLARGVKPGIKLGVCGEHGGDPSSIAFLETLGLDYVSCSPHRVPVARLASAQATLG